jgi:hypothetical protein
MIVARPLPLGEYSYTRYSSLPLGETLVGSLLVTSPRRITRLLALLPSSLAVAKHLCIAGILPFVIASCLLNYPLIYLLILKQS